MILLVLGAGLGAGVWYLKQPDSSGAQFQTAEIERGEVVQIVTATGQLNPVVNVQVGSQISGMIEKLLVDFNSPVKAGQLIAQLDSATYRANVHQAEGDLAIASAALELAQVDATRATELHRQLLISRSEYDKAIATLHQAEATVKLKAATLEKAKVDLARCSIFAPVDGVVISRNVDVGQTVAASLAAPIIFVIANDLSKMQIDANVAEADVGAVENGQDVDFTVDAFPYRTFHGQVVQVRNAPLTVQNVVTYDTVIEVSNPDLKLKPGMTANVSIVIARREQVLKLPNAALRYRPPEAADARAVTAEGRPRGAGGAGGAGRNSKGERSMVRTVYVLAATNSPARAEAPPVPQAAQVKLGISDGLHSEVIEGLQEGAVVVTGLNQAQTSTARPTNPFGGGGMRRF